MLSGITFASAYIIYFKYIAEASNADSWLFGISPEGIGLIGMRINFAVAIAVSRVTPPPPPEVIAMIYRIREHE